MKKTLKRWLQDKIGIGENRDKLVLLEKRIAALATLAQWGLPEVLPIPKNIMASAWEEMIRTRGPEWAQVPQGIHRSDPMFRYPFQVHGGDTLSVLHEYYQTGIAAAQTLQSISSGPQRILDFGGGYGRVGRFLGAAYPEATRMVSDPKPSAVAFQIKHFGALADDQQSVDLIFAGSVFTHLAKETFISTLHALLGRLSRQGKLLLTLHAFDSADFVFHPYTEESALKELEDVLSENAYGSVYCSEAFFTHSLESDPNTANTWRYEVLQNNLFGGTQLYVAVSRA